jgi:nucleotide-binding universal stress UspA family protein
MTTLDNTASTKPVVVGVDGSEPSKEALRWALDYAKLVGAEVHVVLAWHIPAMAYGAGSVYIGDLDLKSANEAVLEQEVKEVAGTAQAVPVTTELINGAPAAELIRAAKDASLLVVGNRGHGAFAGMLLGSVSTHCVTHAPCPVVVVRARHD